MQVSGLEQKYTSKKVKFLGFSFTFLFWGGVYFLNSIFMLSVLLYTNSTSYNFQSCHKSQVILP